MVPMRKSGEASRAKILEAAQAEFAQYGIAGARVARIANNAGVNKAQLYAYFVSKELLFDAVFAEAINSIMDAVPFTPEDLPGYAVALYDDHLAHPELVRLATWSRLERRPTGYLSSELSTEYGNKEIAIAAAQDAGLVDEKFDPFDILASVVAISMAWSPTSTIFAASPTDPVAEHERRRDALRTIVTRGFAPSTQQI